MAIIISTIHKFSHYLIYQSSLKRDSSFFRSISLNLWTSRSVKHCPTEILI